MPAPGAARLFRRARSSALRQLRQLPASRSQSWDGTDRGAKSALGGVTAPASASAPRHLVDVLLGKATERIKQLRPRPDQDLRRRRRSSTRTHGMSVFRQLVALGHLAVDVEGHGGLYAARERLGGAARRGAGHVPRPTRTSRKRREKRARSTRVGRRSSAPADEGAVAGAAAIAPVARARAGRSALCHLPRCDADRHGAAAGRAISTRSRTSPASARSKLERYGATFVAEIIAHDDPAMREAG